MSTEQWRPVVGFPDYEVSDLGRIVSLKHGRRTLMKGWLTEDGYVKVELREGGRSRKPILHKLVAEHFIGPRPDGLEIRHLNGNKLDNRAENLAFGTRSQNIIDQVQHGVHNMATKTHCPSGHPYDDANTYLYPNGYRGCRTCRSASNRRRYAERAA